MLSTYKKRIIKELGRVPEEKMPKLYKVIHQITSEFISKAKKPGKRGSLKGLWKGSSIGDSLFFEAKKPSSLMNPIEVRIDFITEDTRSQ
ncbi:MAG: hypothetical protein NUV74_11660 [Candidatus Brocadiaceae bacterium]|nr:hypothetical protein [Candidatus Brocadiaceae bacterium]